MRAEEVLTEAGVEFLSSGHHHCRPGWIQIRDCPYCGSSNYHLGYNLESGFFACWRCGGHRTRETFIALGLDDNQVRRIAPCDTPETEFERTRTRNYGVKLPLVGPLQAPHRRYLRSRGFDPSEISKTWGVKGIGIAPRLSWRLFIPITKIGKLVSWTTRAIGTHVEQRYISASAEEEIVNHKHLVYGRDFCRGSVVVVEGPADAWRVGPGAGALFGTAFSTAQVRELANIPRRFICFDSGREAQNHARVLADQLACFPGSTETIELDAKDPGEASDKEIRLLRKIAGL